MKAEKEKLSITHAILISDNNRFLRLTVGAFLEGENNIESVDLFSSTNGLFFVTDCGDFSNFANLEVILTFQGDDPTKSNNFGISLNLSVLTNWFTNVLTPLLSGILCILLIEKFTPNSSSIEINALKAATNKLLASFLRFLLIK